MDKFEQIAIGELWNELSKEGRSIHQHKDYELMDVGDIQIQTHGNRYVNMLWLSRHKTIKHIFRITISSMLNKHEIETTEDHVCMKYNKDHFFEQVASKDLVVNDMVSTYDEKTDSELFGLLTKIEDIGTTDEYVYDCEVDDDEHVFYANDVLIHNSQFTNLQCITDYFKKKFNLPEKIMEWSDEYKMKLWKFVDNFVEKDVNGFVQKLISEKCYSEHPEVLRYSLEYIGDCGIYEAKKHYGVHKIVSEGPEICDKLKYTGIELKKATVPAPIKKFLKDIYENTLLNDWTGKDFDNYIDQCYEKFCKMSVNDIAIWKGWSSDKIESDGFLSVGVGTTGISKACRYFNDIINDMKIGKKYSQLMVGNKYRFVYLDPSNQYGINCIAFEDGQWPEEFNDIFHIDYDLMFQKLILQPLKGYFDATRFTYKDPRTKPLFDINEL